MRRYALRLGVPSTRVASQPNPYHPDGGALQNYINTLYEPHRSVFLHDLQVFLLTHLGEIGHTMRWRLR